MSRWKVYKMAAVGCMDENSAKDSEEGGDKNKPDISDLCKKNGVNYKSFNERKSCDFFNSKGVFLEKITKVNGIVKSNSFTKPSVPTLRSRGERHPSGPDSPRRKRRNSIKDRNDLQVTTSKEELSNSHFTCPRLDLWSDKNEDSCSSLPEEKEIRKITNGPCMGQITPDTSRSCTPLSLSGSCVLSPIGKDGITTDPLTNNNNKDSTRTCCQWSDCDIELETVNLMDHIKQKHVETQHLGENKTFKCLWKGCKVYDKTSSSKSWLERHILCHSGDKPFKCIVDGCHMRFTSQKGLERHVNRHFNSIQTPNQKPQKSREDTPTKLWRRKRVKRRRPEGKKPTDYFDIGIMEHLQQQLCSLTEKTQIDLNGSSNSVTFHSSVIARRKEESGKVKVLLHWTPENVLSDEWVPESEMAVLHTRVIPINKLPLDTAINLHPSLYHQHRYRKHRRK